MRKQKTGKNTSVGMIRVNCPRCKNPFGLSTRFVERVGIANFHYQCPYCRYEAAIKET